MRLEAEHRTEAAGEELTIPGGGAANHFPFFHAPEVEVFTLRIACKTLGNEVAFGNREGWAAVRNHRRRFADCGENLLKLASTAQFGEERLALRIEPGIHLGNPSPPLQRRRPLSCRPPTPGHLEC